MDWLDHLDVLGAIRVSQVSTMKKFIEYYTSELDGYACIGLKLGTEEYYKAVEMLKSIGMGERALVPNVLLDGYVRIEVRNKYSIRDLMIVRPNGNSEIKEDEIEVLEGIWNMYIKDNILQQKVNKKFIELWDSFEILKKVRMWWEQIPTGYTITSVGTVLAHTNAKRCDSQIPDLL